MNSSLPIQPATSFFQVHQHSGVCKTSRSVLLLLLAFWIPPSLCSFALGSTTLRRKVAVKLSAPWEPYRHFISTLGSISIRLIFESIIAAGALSAPSTSKSFGHAYWIWLLRPGPASFLCFVSLAEPSLFFHNFAELNFIEGLIGFLTIIPFRAIAHSLPAQRKWMDRQLNSTTLDQQLGYIRIRDGSKFGIATFAFSVLAGLIAVGSVEKSDAWRRWKAYNVMSVLLNFIRMVSSFAVWVAIPMLDPVAFCPSLAATGGLAVLSMVVNVVDHILRALMSQDRVVTIPIAKSIA